MVLAKKEKCVILAERLAVEVYRLLQRARAVHGDKRSRLLEDAFVNLSRPIEEDILRALLEDVPPRSVYYYELVAEFFACRPAEGDDIHAVCSAMMTHPYVPPIYAMMFFRKLAAGELSLSRANIWLKGVNQLFYMDLERKTRVFEAIFDIVQRDFVLGLSAPVIRALPASLRKDILALVFRLFFYYDDGARCVEFLKEVQMLLSVAISSGGLVAPSTPSRKQAPELPVARAVSSHHVRLFDIFEDPPPAFPVAGSSSDEEAPVRDGGKEVPRAEEQPSVASEELHLPALVVVSEQVVLNRLDPLSKCLECGSSVAEVTQKVNVELEKEEAGESDTEDDGTGASGTSRTGKQSFSDEAEQETMEEELLDAVTEIEFAFENQNLDDLSVAELFVRETVYQLIKIQRPETAVVYLQNLHHIVHLDLSDETRIRVQSALYSLSTPGPGPSSDRRVRATARRALDTLFPEGAYARKLVHLSFRVFHSMGWPKSLFLWGVSKVQDAWKALGDLSHQVVSLKRFLVLN